MSVTWRGVPDPMLPRLRLAGRLRIAGRALLLAVVIPSTVAVFGLVRAVEHPIHNPRRPWSPHVVQRGFRLTLRAIGLRLQAHGTPITGLGAQVVNHQSWLDIFVLASAARVTFVSKAEVRSWPVMGWLAAIAGTLFISRRRGDAATQRAMLRERLDAGDTLAFFPEGTSTDGSQVLPFKSALFAVLADLPDAKVQPVTVRYEPPPGERKEFYGWWGGMTLVPHLAQVLAARRQGRAVIIYHDPVPIAEHDRKALARITEETVRQGLVATAP